MKIIALQAENVKKLIAVEIRPDGNMVQITGANGQGKTSVLDCIWWALEGATHIQAMPIRKGQNQARIRLDLGEIVVTRNFKQGKDGAVSSITVENAEGVRLPSPQSVLDSLLGELTFDPLAFTRMTPMEQFNTLRSFVPEVDFDKIDAENKSDYQKRTELNKRIKEARTMASAITVPANIPTEEVSELAIIDELEQAGKHNGDIEVRKNNRNNMVRTIKDNREKAAALIKEADDLQVKLDQAKPLPAPTDILAIRQRLDEAKTVNDMVRAALNKAAHEATAKKFEADADALTKAMDAREEDKKTKIAKAKLPVPGIAFGDGFILLNGVPFDQGSDAEQLKSSIAIAMALNSKLRVIRVRDGSLLDETSMKILAEMADQRDYQIWIERVDSSGKVGFVLEDGHLKVQENPYLPKDYRERLEKQKSAPEEF